MGKRDTIRVSRLLFDFIGWVDYFENQHLPISEIEKLRMDLVHAVWNNDAHELKEFCKEVIRLQQYRYQLNGAAGVETREWIPAGSHKSSLFGGFFVDIQQSIYFNNFLVEFLVELHLPVDLFLTNLYKEQHYFTKVKYFYNAHMVFNSQKQPIELILFCDNLSK